MKKFLIISFVASILVLSVSAEDFKHAIGFRLGKGTYGTGFGLSYQESTGPWNRIEMDLGVSDGFGATFVYKWTRNITGDLNIFAGPAAQLRMLQDKNGIAFGGQVGVEYLLELGDFPLLIGFDMRPMWGTRDYIVEQEFPSDTEQEDEYRTDTGFIFDGALSLRYAF